MSAPHPAGLADRVWDALVVGAGPAGSMTARELALAGASVLLVDRQPFPRWKVCGTCLSPGALSILADAGLGLLPGELGAVPLRTLRLAGWSRRAEVPLRGSMAVSRGSFDAALAESATRAGVTFVAPARARPADAGARDDADTRAARLEVDGVAITVRARIVVAADGLGSTFLAAARAMEEEATVDVPGAATPTHAPTAPGGSRIGVGALFGRNTPGYEPGVVHMGVGDEGYVGLVRLEDGTLDVACALEPGSLGGGARPEDLVQAILRQAGMGPLPHRPMAGWKGTPALTQRPAARGARRLFAVGDAAGYVEPFTGEGMAWALGGARTLAPIVADAMAGWDPASVAAWERAYRVTVGRAAALCRGVAWGLRRPIVARAALRVIHLAPFMASPLVRHAARAPSRPRTLSALGGAPS